MSAQLGLGLEGGAAFGVADAPRGIGELGDGDEMPAGPYRIGLTHWEGGFDGLPYTVCCGDGRAVAGHVPSREIAQAITDALNARAPK